MQTMTTIETLKKCKESHQFLLLGNKPQFVSILDSSLIWSLSKNIVFHTGYRLVGTIPQIKSTLTDLKLSNDIINSVVNSCITHDNHNQLFNSVYNQELIDYSNYIKTLVSQPSNPDIIPQNISHPALIPPINPKPTLIPHKNTNYLQSLPLQEEVLENRTTTSKNKRGITRIPLQNQPIVNNTANYLQLFTPIKTCAVPSPHVNDDEEKFEDITGHLDIFDFEKYQEDFALLSQYFDNVELYLRKTTGLQ